MPSIPCGGGHDAAAGVVGEPGLQSGGTGIAPQQWIQVVWIESLVVRGGGDRDFLLAGDRSQRGIVLVEVRRSMSQVVRRHHMTGRIEPAGRDEVARAQADALGLLVHLPDEAVPRHYAPRHRFEKSKWSKLAGGGTTPSLPAAVC